ncbi:MAG: ABC transporter ATP-binding protein [Flavobacteriaceae bacterium]
MNSLKALNKYLYKYRLKLFLGFVITIVSRIFSLFAPRLIGNSLTTVERYLNNVDADLGEIKEILLMNILVILAASIISGFFTFLMRQTIINVSRYIEFDLKNDIFAHYQLLGQKFYKNNRTGDLMNRISEDVGKVRMYVGPAIMYSTNTLALFIIVISYMVSIAPELTFYTVLPLPFLSYIIYKLSKIINQKSTAVQQFLSGLSSFTQERFSGIAIIKTYGLEQESSRSFGDLAQTGYDKNMDLAKLQAWFFPLMILLIGLSNLLVIFIGGKQYMDGQIEIGVLAEFIIYINMLTWPVAVVGWVSSIVQQAAASQQRINDFLEEKPEIIGGEKKALQKDFALEFKDVCLSYPETSIQALKHVSFRVEEGQTLGIIGSIGSGKSTLLDLITRIYNPQEGTVFIGGVPIQEFDLQELRKMIATVPQNPFLFSETIRQNILFGKPDATPEEVQAAAKAAAVHDNIIDFKEGYDTLLGERGVTLSGGQIQRISIARALIKDAPILLFDDCLSAVDTDTEELILSHLKQLSQHKTSCIVSHRISSVIDADLILVLEEGRIIQAGDHKSLKEKEGYYRELYRKQQGNSL